MANEYRKNNNIYESQTGWGLAREKPRINDQDGLFMTSVAISIRYLFQSAINQHSV
jgi:hypothetical protein